MYRYFSFLFYSTIFFNSFLFSVDNGSVEHKNTSIDHYLNQISEEQQEKTQILHYMITNGSGTYMDIGTGGDSVSYMLGKIPSEYPITLIASDIDQSILDAIPNRHPEIKPFLNQCDDQSLRLKLMRMDATNMIQVSESSLE